jgi:hypothetical protein
MGTSLSRGCCKMTTRVRVRSGDKAAHKQTTLGRSHCAQTLRGTKSAESVAAVTGARTMRGESSPRNAATGPISATKRGDFDPAVLDAQVQREASFVCNPDDAEHRGRLGRRLEAAHLAIERVLGAALDSLDVPA